MAAGASLPPIPRAATQATLVIIRDFEIYNVGNLLDGVLHPKEFRCICILKVPVVYFRYIIVCDNYLHVNQTNGYKTTGYGLYLNVTIFKEGGEWIANISWNRPIEGE